MNILVVDDNAETAADLAQGLAAAAGYTVATAVGADEALALTQTGTILDLLIAEVVLPTGDGFSLRDTLQQASPEMRTIYVTGYDLTEYQDFLKGAPVFYKPVSIEHLLAEIARAPKAATQLVAAAGPGALESGPAGARRPDELTNTERSQTAQGRGIAQKQGFTGKLDLSELVDIIQMCCLSKRTGCLQVSHRHERGTIYLRRGQIIHAINGARVGEEAVYQIIGWAAGQFSFEEGTQPDRETLQGRWEHLIMEGVRRRDEHNQAVNVAANARLDLTVAGQSLGPYRLRRKIGQGERSEVFEALQTSMNRVVALKLLLSEYEADEIAARTFLAEASVKAKVQHPCILTVYEAGQSDGIYYYAREFVDGSSLTELRAEGHKMDDASALRLIRVVAEALDYLTQQRISHRALTSDALYLGRDGQPHVDNIATLPDVKSPMARSDIRALSRIVSDCLPDRGASSVELRSLLGRMLLNGNHGFLSWKALLQVIRPEEPAGGPEDALERSVQDNLTVVAHEARPRPKPAQLGTTVGMISGWLGFRTDSEPPRSPKN